MKSLKLKRTFKEGLDNFRRNGWLSFATVSILAISLYIISVTIILGVAASIALKNTQDSINVSIYFNLDVTEERILEIKDKLVGYEEIKSIDYVSREQALEQLKDYGNKSPFIMQALDVIGENPLAAALVIKAKDPGKYELIANSISNSSFSQEINYINFDENKDEIEKLISIIGIVRKVGFTIGIVFVFIGILVTFNAIRLTMYAHRQEFEIMRLVGASNMYIKMPFIFEGIFYGVSSAVVVMMALYLTSLGIAPLTKGNVDGASIVSFYLGNFFAIFGLLLLSGILLGTLSGIIAIRRYLKI